MIELVLAVLLLLGLLSLEKLWPFIKLTGKVFLVLLLVEFIFGK